MKNYADASSNRYLGKCTPAIPFLISTSPGELYLAEIAYQKTAAVDNNDCIRVFDNDSSGDAYGFYPLSGRFAFPANGKVWVVFTGRKDYIQFSLSIGSPVAGNCYANIYKINNPNLNISYERAFSNSIGGDIPLLNHGDRQQIITIINTSGGILNLSCKHFLVTAVNAFNWLYSDAIAIPINGVMTFNTRATMYNAGAGDVYLGFAYQRSLSLPAGSYFIRVQMRLNELATNSF